MVGENIFKQINIIRVSPCKFIKHHEQLHDDDLLNVIPRYKVKIPKGITRTATIKSVNANDARK